MAHLTGIAYGGVVAVSDEPTAERRRRRSRRWHQVAEPDDAARRPRHDRRSRATASLALTRVGDALRRARQPLPAPGRPARRGLDREGLAALPVARLRLRPAHRHAAARVLRRARVLPGRGARRRHLRRRSPAERAARAHRLRRDGRDDGRLGRHPRVRHGRPLEPRASPTRCVAPRSAATSRSSASATRARPRSRRRRTASSPAGRPRASRIAGPGLDQPAHRPLRRQGRPRAGARAVGPGAVEGARPRRVPGRRPQRRLRRRRAVLADRAAGVRPRRADDAGAASTPTVERDVAHLVFPDEVQVLAGRRRPEGVAARSAGSATTASRHPRPRSTTRCALIAGARRPGDRRRPRRPLRHGRGARARRGAGRAGAHHVQGQGPRLRPPPARLRGARPQRHAGRELAHERVRPARRVRRVVLEPHRHRAVQADRAGRLRPDGARPVPPGDRAGARPRRRDRARCCVERARAPAATGSTSGPTSPQRWAIWRAEKARRLADDRGRGVSSAAVFDALTRLVPGRRGDRRRRRQQRLLVRPLLRVRRASRC